MTFKQMYLTPRRDPDSFHRPGSELTKEYFSMKGYSTLPRSQEIEVFFCCCFFLPKYCIKTMKPKT